MTEKQGPRVLLVDDEESIQQTLGAVLPVASYAVYQVREAIEAVRRVPLVRPDLVLLDLGLPDIDGREVIRHLREWSIAPIIVISVRHDESEKSVASILALMTTSQSRLRCQSCWRACAQPCAALTQHRTTFLTVSDLKVDFTRREVFVGESEADPIQ